MESRKSQLERLVRTALEDDKYAGAAYGLSSAEETVFGSVGFAQTSEPVRSVELDTIFDVASLTKPLITATLTLRLHELGKLDLDRPIDSTLDECHGMGQVTAKHLLAHTSGLPDWYPCYLRGNTKSDYLKAITDQTPTREPGSRTLYSDLGYLLLGIVLERLTGENLSILARDFILEPLALQDSFFPCPVDLAPRVAATERGNAKERELAARIAGSETLAWTEDLWCGVPHDRNARELGGVAGHAGLFSTVADVSKLGRAMLGSVQYLSAQTRETLFCAAYPDADGSARSLGWLLTSDPHSEGHGVLSARSVGHTGYTGCGIWLDRNRDEVYVLLSNAVHPYDRGRVLAPVRRRFLEICAADAKWE